MDVPDLSSTAELDWQMFHNEHGLYESAGRFEDLIEDVEDTDLDLTEPAEIDPETLNSELTNEQIYALTAFNHLTLRYVSMFSDTDLKEGILTGPTTVDEYLGE